MHMPSSRRSRGGSIEAAALTGNGAARRTAGLDSVRKTRLACLCSSLSGPKRAGPMEPDSRELASSNSLSANAGGLAVGNTQGLEGLSLDAGGT